MLNLFSKKNILHSFESFFPAGFFKKRRDQQGDSHTRDALPVVIPRSACCVACVAGRARP